jgi:hypothetical protein
MPTHRAPSPDLDTASPIPVPNAPAPPSAAGHGPPAETTRWPSLRQHDRIIHIDDPTHGHLEITASAFHAAMRQPHDTLTAILAQRPWVTTTPDQPMFLTAALTALHAPSALAALTTDPTHPAPPLTQAIPATPDPATPRLRALPDTPAPEAGPTLDPGL